VDGLTVGRIPSNVYFVQSGPSWVLIDTSWSNSAQVIRQAAGSLFGPGARPAAILLTHIHPDHPGSAPELASFWNVPVFVSSDEPPMVTGNYAVGDYRSQDYPPLDRWLLIPVMRLLPRGMRARIRTTADMADVVRTFDPHAGAPELPG
jgi:glyoxylase-like metal-dependent hydrolase (beta-lactamase superfamily II)